MLWKTEEFHISFKIYRHTRTHTLLQSAVTESQFAKPRQAVLVVPIGRTGKKLGHGPGMKDPVTLLGCKHSQTRLGLLALLWTLLDPGHTCADINHSGFRVTVDLLGSTSQMPTLNHTSCHYVGNCLSPRSSSEDHMAP